MSLPLSPDEQRDLLVSIKTHRGSRRLSPLQVAALFAKALESGATLGECAAAVGLGSTAMVSRFLRLLELPLPVQQMAGWGGSTTSLPFSSASEIARLPSEQQEPVAKAVISAGLGAGETKQAVQRLLRSDLGAEEAVQEILKLRPSLERRYVVVGSFGDDSLAEALASVDADERNRLLDVLIQREFALRDVSARLEPTGFVLSGPQALADRLEGFDDVEGLITEKLREQLSGRE